MFGLGKTRTKFGKWIDREGLSQVDIMNICDTNKNTVTMLCSDIDYNPNISTKTRVISKLRRAGFDVEMSDFW